MLKSARFITIPLKVNMNSIQVVNIRIIKVFRLASCLKIMKIKFQRDMSLIISFTVLREPTT